MSKLLTRTSFRSQFGSGFENITTHEQEFGLWIPRAKWAFGNDIPPWAQYEWLSRAPTGVRQDLSRERERESRGRREASDSWSSDQCPKGRLCHHFLGLFMGTGVASVFLVKRLFVDMQGRRAKWSFEAGTREGTHVKSARRGGSISDDTHVASEAGCSFPSGDKLNKVFPQFLWMGFLL